MALQEGLLARVDRLSEDAQAVIRVAAAAGRDVDHELLALVADRHTGITEPRLL
jgi:predicted ATPase